MANRNTHSSIWRRLITWVHAVLNKQYSATVPLTRHKRLQCLDRISLLRLAFFLDFPKKKNCGDT